MVRVVVVDDDALVRSGLQLILRVAADIEVVATASGGEAIDAITRHRPDVVLLDIRMPDVDGLTILRQVRAMPHPPTVAMLTTFDADEYITTALRAGAAGFILKDTHPEQLAQLVRTLAAGAVVLSPKVSRSVVDWRLENGEDAAGAIARLTGRERDILVHIAGGLSNTEIGTRMYLSAGTVKDHVSAILTKLRVSSRVQAALIAQRAGLLTHPDGMS
ncbi:response regulator transcription factor [Actinoplanes sp. NEAU-A12]|uniref:Response regulator transcription factor n=1 Tax=Actinoplanes sandaracinus TaxID=3045177 RepID=A0ABT6WY23_9ACTN|nr:response regulator transcription factor [Actinoplanes sandaracinus]MDI6104637.1 response regulator transcription factor [Actinoplanes sandaracinus]